MKKIFDDDRKKIILHENKKEYRAINSEKYRVIAYKLDLNQTDQKNCDFLLVCDTISCYFIELKGKDISSAAQQILSSIEQNLDSIKKVPVNARIVASRISRPNLRSSHFLKLQKLIGSLNGNLKYSAQVLTEELP